MVSKRRKSCARYPGCYNQRKGACEKRVDCQWVVGSGCHAAVNPQYVPVKTVKALTTQLETVRRELTRVRGTRVAGDAAATAMTRRIAELEAAEARLQTALTDVQAVAERRRVGLERVEAELGNVRTAHAQCQRRSVNAEIRQRALEAEVARLRREGADTEQRRMRVQAQLAAVSAASAASTRALTQQLETVQANLTQLQQERARVEQELRDALTTSQRGSATNIRRFQQRLAQIASASRAVEAERARLSGELARARESQTQLQAQVTELRQASQTIEAARARMQAELQTVTTQLATQTAEKDQLQQELRRKSKLVKRADRLLQDYARKLPGLMSSLEDKKNAEIRALQDQLAACQQSKQEVQTNLAQTTQTLERTQNEAQAIMDELQDLDDALSGARRYQRGVQDEFKQVQRERAEQRVILESLQVKFSNLQEALESAESLQKKTKQQVYAEVQRTYRLAAEATRLKQLLAEKTAALNNTDARVATLEAAARTSEMTVEELEADVAALKAALAAITATNTATTLERDELQRTVTAQTQALQTLREETRELEAVRQQLQEQLSMSGEEVATRSAASLALAQQVASLQAQIASLQAQSQSDKTVSEDEARRLRAELAAATRQLADAQRDMADNAEAARVAEAEVNRLNTELITVSQVQANMNGLLLESEALNEGYRAQLVEKEAALKASVAELQEVTLNRDALDRANTRLEFDIQRLTQTVEDNQGKLEELIARSLQERQEADKVSAKLQTVRRDRDSLKAAEARLSTQVDELSVQMSALSDEVVGLVARQRTLTQQVLEGKKDAKVARDEATRLAGRLELVRNQLAAKNADLTKAQQSQQAAQRMQAAAQKRVGELEQARDTAQEEARKVQATLDATLQQQAQMSEQLQLSQEELSGLQLQLAEERAGRVAALVAKEELLQDALRRITELQQSGSKAEQDALMKDLVAEELAAEAASLEEANAQLTATLEETRANLAEALDEQQRLRTTNLLQAAQIAELEAQLGQLQAVNAAAVAELQREIKLLKALEVQLRADLVAAQASSEANEAAAARAWADSQAETQRMNARLAATTQQAEQAVARVAQLEQTLAAANARADSLQTQLEAALAQSATLTLQLSEVQAARAEVEQEAADVKTRMTRLTAEMERERDQSGALVSTLRADLEEARAEARDVEERERRLLAQEEALRGELRAAQESQASLETQLEQTRADLNVQARANAELLAKMNTALEQLKESEDVNTAYLSTISELRDEVNAEKGVLAQTQAELASVIEQRDQNELEKQNVERDLNETVRKHDLQLRQLEAANAQVQEELERLRVSEDERVSALSSELAFANSRIVAATLREAELTAQLRASEARVIAADANVARLEKQLEDLLASGSTQTSTIEALRAQLAQAQADKVSVEQQAAATAAEYEAQIAPLREAVAYYKEVEAEMAAQLEEKDSQLVQLLAAREEVVGELAARGAEVELVKVDLEAAQERNAQLKQEVAAARQDAERQLAAVRAELEQQIEAANEMALNQRESAKARMAEVRAELAAARASGEAQLVQERARAQALEQAQAALTEEVAAVAQAQQRQQGELARAREALRESERVVSQLDVMLLAVQEEVRRATAESAALRSDKAAVTQALEASARDLGVTQRELEAAQRVTEQQRATLAEANARVAGLERELEAASLRAAEVSALTTELQEVKKQRDRIQSQLNVSNTNFESTVSTLRAQLENKDAELRLKQIDLQVALSRASRLSSEQETLRAQLDEEQANVRSLSARASAPQPKYIPTFAPAFAPPVTAAPPDEVDADSPREVMQQFAANLFHIVRDVRNQLQSQVDEQSSDVLAALTRVVEQFAALTTTAPSLSLDRIMGQVATELNALANFFTGNYRLSDVERQLARRVQDFFTPIRDAFLVLGNKTVQAGPSGGQVTLFQRVQQDILTRPNGTTVGIRTRVRELLEEVRGTLSRDQRVQREVDEALDELNELDSRADILQYGLSLHRLLERMLQRLAGSGYTSTQLVDLGLLSTYVELVSRSTIGSAIMSLATREQDNVVAAALQVGGAVSTAAELVAELVERGDAAASDLQTRLSALRFQNLAADGGVAFVNFLSEAASAAARMRQSEVASRLTDLARVAGNTVVRAIQRSAANVGELLASTAEWLYNAARQGARGMEYTVRREAYLAAQALQNLYDNLQRVDYRRGMKYAAQQVSAVLQQVGQVLTTAAANLGGELMAGVVQLAGTVYQVGQSMLAAAGSLATAAYRTLQAFAAQAANRIVEVTGAVATALGREAAMARDSAAQQLYQLVDELRQFDYRGTFERTQQQLNDLYERVQATLRRALSIVTPYGEALLATLRSLVEQLGAVWSSLRIATAGVVQRVVGAASSVVTGAAAWTVGQALAYVRPTPGMPAPGGAPGGAGDGTPPWQIPDVSVSVNAEPRCANVRPMDGRLVREKEGEMMELDRKQKTLVAAIERETGMELQDIVVASARWPLTDPRRKKLNAALRAYKDYVHFAVSFYRHCRPPSPVDQELTQFVAELKKMETRVNAWLNLQIEGGAKAAALKEKAKLLQQTFLRGGMSQHRYERKLTKLRRKYDKLKGQR